MRKYKRKNTLRRHKMIKQYFDKLHEGRRRLRYDDALKMTAAHFAYAEETIIKILAEQEQLPSPD